MSVASDLMLATAGQSVSDGKGGTYVADGQGGYTSYTPGPAAANAAAKTPAVAAQSAEITANAADPNNPMAATNIEIARLQDQQKKTQDSLDTANQRLALEQATGNLNKAKFDWQQKIQEAQLQGKDTQLMLNQAKADLAQQALAWQEKIGAAKEADAQQRIANAEAKGQATAATTVQGQEVTQADTRSSNAKDVLDNAGSLALNVAKGGGTAAQIGDVLQGMIGAAPGVQASMGGAPVAFTPDHFQQIVNMIRSGQVQPDANGNYVPNAVKALAAQSGVQPNQTPQIPADVAANVGTAPTLAAAGSGGLSIPAPAAA